VDALDQNALDIGSLRQTGHPDDVRVACKHAPACTSVFIRLTIRA
jgi:hypothetical protein